MISPVNIFEKKGVKLLQGDKIEHPAYIKGAFKA